MFSKNQKSIHSVPEDIGKEAANRLLEEIYRGGNVDSTFQWLVPLYMALAQKDVSKFLTGKRL
jgi:RNA 3'-terminal phosphate cyclase-like protein